MSDGLTESRDVSKYAMSLVRAGKVYRHFKGEPYVVIAVTDSSGDLETQSVTYMNLITGAMWDRSLEEFASPKVHDNGEEEARFTHMGYASIGINEDGRYKVTQVY